jgi:hypothetical protein
MTITALSLAGIVALSFPVRSTGEDDGTGEKVAIEIDFSSLPGKDGKVLMLDKDGKATYDIALTIEAAGEIKLEEKYNIAEGTENTGVRDLVKVSLRDGWKVESVGENKLIIRAYKDSPVRKVAIKVERIPLSMTPTTRRLTEKDK